MYAECLLADEIVRLLGAVDADGVAVVWEGPARIRVALEARVLSEPRRLPWLGHPVALTACPLPPAEQDRPLHGNIAPRLLRGPGAAMEGDDATGRPGADGSRGGCRGRARLGVACSDAIERSAPRRDRAPRCRRPPSREAHPRRRRHSTRPRRPRYWVGCSSGQRRRRRRRLLRHRRRRAATTPPDPRRRPRRATSTSAPPTVPPSAPPHADPEQTLPPPTNGPVTNTAASARAVRSSTSPPASSRPPARSRLDARRPPSRPRPRCSRRRRPAYRPASSGAYCGCGPPTARARTRPVEFFVYDEPRSTTVLRFVPGDVWVAGQPNRRVAVDVAAGGELAWHDTVAAPVVVGPGQSVGGRRSSMTGARPAATGSSRPSSSPPEPAPAPVAPRNSRRRPCRLLPGGHRWAAGELADGAVERPVGAPVRHRDELRNGPASDGGDPPRARRHHHGCAGDGVERDWARDGRARRRTYVVRRPRRRPWPCPTGRLVAGSSVGRHGRRAARPPLRVVGDPGRNNGRELARVSTTGRPAFPRRERVVRDRACRRGAADQWQRTPTP